MRNHSNHKSFLEVPSRYNVTLLRFREGIIEYYLKYNVQSHELRLEIVNIKTGNNVDIIKLAGISAVLGSNETKQTSNEIKQELIQTKQQTSNETKESNEQANVYKFEGIYEPQKYYSKDCIVIHSNSMYLKNDNSNNSIDSNNDSWKLLLKGFETIELINEKKELEEKKQQLINEREELINEKQELIEKKKELEKKIINLDIKEKSDINDDPFDIVCSSDTFYSFMSTNYNVENIGRRCCHLVFDDVEIPSNFIDGSLHRQIIFEKSGVYKVTLNITTIGIPMVKFKCYLLNIEDDPFDYNSYIKVSKKKNVVSKKIKGSVFRNTGCSYIKYNTHYTFSFRAFSTQKLVTVMFNKIPYIPHESQVLTACGNGKSWIMIEKKRMDKFHVN